MLEKMGKSLCGFHGIWLWYKIQEEKRTPNTDRPTYIIILGKAYVLICSPKHYVPEKIMEEKRHSFENNITVSYQGEWESLKKNILLGEIRATIAHTRSYYFVNFVWPARRQRFAQAIKCVHGGDVCRVLSSISLQCNCIPWG